MTTQARQRELATAFSHVEKCEELSKKKVEQVTWCSIVQKMI